MNYKKAYLHTFNRISDLVKVLEGVEMGKEAINIPACLKELQCEAETICIAGEGVAVPTYTTKILRVTACHDRAHAANV